MADESRYRGLIPYKSGAEWTGNAHGRPPGTTTIRGLFKRVLEDTQCLGRQNPPGYDNARVLVEACVYHAKMGNYSYFKELADVIDGKIPDAEPKPDLTMEMMAAEIKKKAAKSKSKQRK